MTAATHVRMSDRQRLAWIAAAAVAVIAVVLTLVFSLQAHATEGVPSAAPAPVVVTTDSSPVLSKDDLFLTRVHARSVFVFELDADNVSLAHTVCYGLTAMSGDEVLSAFTESGVSATDGRYFITQAVAVYCPQRKLSF